MPEVGFEAKLGEECVVLERVGGGGAACKITVGSQCENFVLSQVRNVAGKMAAR